jgi:hypothetical protein
LGFGKMDILMGLLDINIRGMLRRQEVFGAGGFGELERLLRCSCG